MENHGYEPQQLIGLTAVAEGEDHIVGRHHTQVAMIDIEGIDEESWGARRCQRGGNLRSYIAALAHTGDDNLAFAGVHHADRLVEVVVELGDELKGCLSFVLNTLNGILADVLQPLFCRSYVFYHYIVASLYLLH